MAVRDLFLGNKSHCPLPIAHKLQNLSIGCIAGNMPKMLKHGADFRRNYPTTEFDSMGSSLLTELNKLSATNPLKL